MVGEGGGRAGDGYEGCWGPAGAGEEEMKMDRCRAAAKAGRGKERDRGSLGKKNLNTVCGKLFVVCR